MGLLAFDTHKFITSLTAAGMAPKQAEVLAETYASLLTAQVATKQDIAALKQDIQALEHRIDAKLLKYISGGVAVIVAVLTLFEFVIR